MSQYSYAHRNGGFLPQFRSTVLVAAGSNRFSPEGAPRETISHALKVLSRKGCGIRAVSSFFRTPCFPPGAGPDYVNAAFLLELDGDARQSLDLLHGVEAELGRERTTRWGPRTLDLDLIACGQQVRPDRATVQRWIDLPPDQQMRIAPGELVLPHPRMQDRAFVLVPLMEIMPQWVHPLIGRTVRQMHDALPAADRNAVNPLVFPAKDQ